MPTIIAEQGHSLFGSIKVPGYIPAVCASSSNGTGDRHFTGAKEEERTNPCDQYQNTHSVSDLSVSLPYLHRRRK